MPTALSNPVIVFPRGVFFCAVCLATFLWASLWASFTPGPRAAESAAAGGSEQFDVTLRRVASIPPGTVVGERAPEGWSHLVIKSRPRLSEQSAKELPAVTARLATLLCTVILADVQGRPGQFVLSHLAVGLGAEINGRDTIVSTESASKLGLNLGVLESQVLAGAEKQLGLMRTAARSRTAAVVDAAGVLLHDKRHQAVVLRYVLLVDPNSGRLDVLAWAFPRQADGPAQPIGDIQLLPPNKLDDCLLSIDKDAFLLGIPTSTAFAMVQIPQGKPITFPKELRAVACQPQLTTQQAQQLTAALRVLVQNAAAASEQSSMQKH